MIDALTGIIATEPDADGRVYALADDETIRDGPCVLVPAGAQVQRGTPCLILRGDEPWVLVGLPGANADPMLVTEGELADSVAAERAVTDAALVDYANADNARRYATIQQAIDANPGGAVYVEKGIYLLNAGLVVDNKCKLIGEPGTTLVANAAMDALITYRRITDVPFAGVVGFNLDMSAGTADEGLRVEDCWRTAHDVVVTNLGAGIGVHCLSSHPDFGCYDNHFFGQVRGVADTGMGFLCEGDAVNHANNNVCHMRVTHCSTGIKYGPLVDTGRLEDTDCTTNLTGYDIASGTIRGTGVHEERNGGLPSTSGIIVRTDCKAFLENTYQEHTRCEGSAVSRINDAWDFGPTAADHLFTFNHVGSFGRSIAFEADTGDIVGYLNGLEVWRLTRSGSLDVDALRQNGVAAILEGDARLTDSRAPNGAAGGVLSGAYPNPGFAVDMATQAELDAVKRFAGEVTDFAGPEANVPAGWLLCAGQSLLRSGFPALFAAIGTTYGAVDATHFNLPDLRGRVPVGLDNMGGTDAGRLAAANALGGAGGAETHVLSVAEMPSHNHGQLTIGVGLVMDNPGGAGSSARDIAYASRVAGGNPLVPPAQGGGGAHNNMQPYMLLNKIIKT